MATPIRIKRSSVPGKRPTLADLQLGEPAINTYDGKIYLRRDTGVASTVALVTPWIENVGGSIYYTDGNIGIGTTNPTSVLDVFGNGRFTGIVTATTFSGQINAGVATVSSLSIESTQVISSGRELQNILSLDSITTATIEAAITNAPNTFTDLLVTGISTFTNGPVLIGTGTSTGTQNQKLQVSGSAYVSGNLGVGTTNPQTKLEIAGILGFTDSNIRIGNNLTGSSSVNSLHNVIIGKNSATTSSSGIRNVYLGSYSANNQTSGDDNIFIGQGAGYWSTSGSRNVYIGPLTSNIGSDSGSKKIIIGSGSPAVGDGPAYGTWFDAPDPSKDVQLAIGLVDDSSQSRYWLVGNENFNIGIGTTNPTSKLQVEGDALVTGILTVTNGIQGIGIQSAGFNIAVGVITALNFIGAGNTFAYNVNTKTVDINIGGSQWTFVDSSNSLTSNIYRVNGNVGIGTTNPTSKLDVTGNARFTGIVTASTFSGQINAGVGTFTRLVSTATSFSQLQVAGISTFANGPILVGTSLSTGTASQPLQVTGGAYVSGSAGVGITNPREELDVVGDIGIQASGSANRFVIQHNNALSSLDFVFI